MQLKKMGYDIFLCMKQLWLELQTPTSFLFIERRLITEYEFQNKYSHYTN